MKTLLVRCLIWWSGKSQDQLAMDFSIYYWMTRSRAKAYYLAITQ